MKKIIVFIVCVLCVSLNVNSQTFNELLEKAEKYNDANAMAEIGRMYFSGDGVERNDQEAVRWFQKSAGLGNIFGQFYLAVSLCSGRGISVDYDLGAMWALKSANQGHPHAQTLLSELYMNGHGVEQSDSLSFKWLLRACEISGLQAESYYKLALYYANGLGTKVDNKEAFKWSLIAAENGLPEAQYTVGYCYADGDGVQQDKAMALQWLLKAAEQNHADAKYTIALLHARGELGKIDYSQAVKWYRSAMEQNHAWSYNNMAYFYANGTGVEQSMQKAFEMVDKAIELEPTNVRFYDTKGELYSMTGDKEGAIELWNQILKIDTLFKNEDTPFVQYIQRLLSSDVDTNIPLFGERNGKTYVLIISNEEYVREVKVPHALNDGRIFAEYCKKTLGVPESNVHLIENATLNDMKYHINWLKQVLSVTNGEAKVIFYYAGHGIPNEAQKTAYILPVDGYGSDASTGYGLNELYATLGTLPSKSITVFLDACFSGAKREGGMLTASRGVAIKVKPNEPKGNMVVLSASQGDETAYPYKEMGHGMFTYFLLKKLQETKGDVSIGDLSNYIIDNVRRQSVVLNGKMQTPAVSYSTSLGDTWKEWKLR